MDLWEIERGYFDKGVGVIAGVDEAGRGPLAGPVCAGAVILPPYIAIEGLNDSKKLTERARERLYGEITSRAVSWAVGWASSEEIDELNILNATYLAMNRAIAGLAVLPELTIIDGNRANGVTYPNVCVVKGDARSASVAAASIIAKVSRDRLMLELADEYPQYGFERHKGYPTALHYSKLREFGPSPIHRVTFLRKMH